MCVCVFGCELRITTHPWAAERAGGETRGGSTNRPRPVVQTCENTQENSNLWYQHMTCYVFE